MANLMLSVMSAFAEFELSLIRNASAKASPWRNSVVVQGTEKDPHAGKCRGTGPARRHRPGETAWWSKERKKTLTQESAAELVQRAGSGAPKAVLARDYGISRETAYQYLRHAKLE